MLVFLEYGPDAILVDTLDFMMRRFDPSEPRVGSTRSGHRHEKGDIITPLRHHGSDEPAFTVANESDLEVSMSAGPGDRSGG